MPPLVSGTPLAAHSAAAALPFFVPTFVVVVVIGVVIWRDRRWNPGDPGAKANAGEGEDTESAETS